MIRTIALTAAALLLIAAAAILALPRLNLGPLAASRATASLGRTVRLDTLHITPGRWIGIEISGARLANLAGGSRPEMATAARVTAELDARSLLHGPLTIRNLAADGVRVLFERLPDRHANWKGSVERARPAGAPDRSHYPTVLNTTLNGIEILYRGATGTTLRTALDQVSLVTKSAGAPVRLLAAGTYNAAPVSLQADLQSFDALRDTAKPFATDLRMATRETKLHFLGTMTDPLNVDGAVGTLTLDSPKPSQLLALAGIVSTSIPAITVTGPFTRSGDVWAHADATGTLAAMPFRAKTLRLAEGAAGKPDQITADIAFDRLDLGFLDTPGGAGRRTNADISLSVDRNPGALIDAKLAAARMIYGDLAFENTKLDASLTAGRIALRALSLSYLGATGKASATIDAAGDGGRVQVDAALSGDAQMLRPTLGIGKIPLAGGMDAKLSATATGNTVREATRKGRIAAVLSMQSGTMPKEIIEMASTDIRVLFRKPRGSTAISCLLGVATIDGRAGRIGPLRVRSAHGTIAGSGSFDLSSRTLDLVIGSQSATTASFALDIPVQITGSFANPSIRPAKLTASGRALLAAAADLPSLPPDLAQTARRSPCVLP